MFDQIKERRNEVSKLRKPPISLAELDVMEHRFDLYMNGTPICDLDQCSERFIREFYPEGVK